MQKNELEGFHDIYGIWHKPFWQTQWFFIIIISLIALMVLLLFFYIVKKFQRKKSKTAWQHALAELETLKKNNVATVDQCKQFYFALTEILKTYLHQRYGFEVKGKTDVQLLEFLKKSAFPIALLPMMDDIFTGGSFIKFAPIKAAQKQIDESYTASLTIINRTIPIDTKQKLRN